MWNDRYRDPCNLRGRAVFKMTSLFGSGPATPAAPTPTPPPVMPDLNSPAALEAKRKAVMDAGAGGRAATVLTNQGNRGAGTIAGGVGANKLG